MKPLARFGRLIGWEESTGTGAIKAALGSVAHPSLGMQPSVTTSRVERIAYAETGEVAEIETRNTVYRWLEWEPIEHDGWAGEPLGIVVDSAHVRDEPYKSAWQGMEKAP